MNEWERVTDEELKQLVKFELDYLIARYDLDEIGEPPVSEYITEKDLMIEI